MHRNNFLLLSCFLCMILSACIKPYEPDILASDEQKYVVSGQVNTGNGFQKVNVSTSSSISEPRYQPVLGCDLTIVDDQGHSFPMNETGNGDYETFIDPSLLIPGVAFQLMVTTPNGEMLISDFDTLTAGPTLDTVYYERKDIEGNIEGNFTLGIQFYTNLHASSTDSHLFRWEAIETYEYHSLYPLEWYYAGQIFRVVPPDSSKMICYRTLKVPAIFTLSTQYLAENAYDHFELHYVDNRTVRLAYGYSLLVNQYSLSQAGFLYWDQLRINSDQQAGLYEKQPLAVKGNLRNLTHPDLEVLGFFGASTLSSKRIFIYPIPDLPLDYNVYCSETEIRTPLSKFPHSLWPIYLLSGGNNYLPFILDGECIDCELLHGTIVKPSFWPN